MTDRAAVYRDDVLAVVERHLAKWQQLEAANPPAHQFDLTTEAASKLAILDALAEIRALPTLHPGEGWRRAASMAREWAAEASHDGADDAVISELNNFADACAANATTPHREEES